MRGLGAPDAEGHNHGYGNPAHGGDLDTPSIVDSHLVLVSVAADRQDQPSAVLEPGNAVVGMFDAVFPMGAADARIRQSHAVDPARFYPLERTNQEYVLDRDAHYGHEGWDWQNPYSWAARGVLAYPNAASSGLAPNVGGADLGEDPALVALNVRATAGVLEVGGFHTGGRDR